MISQYLRIEEAGGHPACVKLQSLDLLKKTWIKATQSDSSRAGLRVWDALLKLGSLTLSNYKVDKAGGKKQKAVCLVNEKLFS